ncbi:NAD-dependent epimerase/dehydratase family protein, partial [Acinetobacter baumannii]
SMRRALKGVDRVFHLVAKITLAAEDEAAWTLNTKGVRTVAEAALACGVKRVVHCSSIHAFDQYRCGGHIDESSVRSVEPDIPVYD